jgi:hypothetical protein
MEDLIFSKAVKAGKRIYYIDVKKNRKDEMFITLTESKKVVTGEGEQALVSFEKHKIFLYREDFEKFMTALQESVDFATQASAPANEAFDVPEALSDNEIKISLDFEEETL